MSEKLTIAALSQNAPRVIRIPRALAVKHGYEDVNLNMKGTQELPADIADWIAKDARYRKHFRVQDTSVESSPKAVSLVKPNAALLKQQQEAEQQPPNEDQPPAEKINLNTADAEALSAIPFLTDSMIEALIDYRTDQPFLTLEEVDNVPGIGAATVAKLETWATV